MQTRRPKKEDSCRRRTRLVVFVREDLLTALAAGHALLLLLAHLAGGKLDLLLRRLDFVA